MIHYTTRFFAGTAESVLLILLKSGRRPLRIQDSTDGTRTRGRDLAELLRAHLLEPHQRLHRGLLLLLAAARVRQDLGKADAR